MGRERGPSGPEPARAEPVRAVLEPGPPESALSGPSRSERSRSGSLGSVRVKGPKAKVRVGGTKSGRVGKQNFRRSFRSAKMMIRSHHKIFMRREYDWKILLALL